MEAYATLLCCAACRRARRSVLLRERIAITIADAVICEIDDNRGASGVHNHHYSPIAGTRWFCDHRRE